MASILAALLLLTTAARAWAGDPFPVQESFRGPAFGAQWRQGGSAELTGGKEAEGWLRLTSAEGGEFGYAYDDEAFPASAGALVEFEYADWGGSGADGLTFFLFDGATSEAQFHAGQPGGALGYAPCDSTTNGLSNAYVGVGFDEYGNFTNLGSICGLDGFGFTPNHVSIRGSAAESYRLLASAPTTESLRAERSQARRVTIAVTPNGKLSVYVGYPDGTYQQVTENFQLPAAPETLKFGYVASTGALTDYHEIRDAQVLEPTQLTPSIAETAGGGERGKPLTWTAVVRNEGPNPTQREQLRTTTPGQAPANASWTCEAAGGAECGASSGTGLPNPEAGAMPQGSSLTYRITGTPTPTTDYAQMTIESEPRGDTGELDPERERATAKVNLTPLFQEEPSFTLAPDGEATAAPVGALGGEISYSYAWQRCEPNGTACADIPGAQAPTHHTTPADTGHTLRFTETATNSVGSATVDSGVYRLPSAEIASAPAGFLATREAALSFSSSTDEATFECSLDGAAWSACASPLSYDGLADGEHTFSVRAVYGGLSGPEPASARWTTEATPPPAPTIAALPSAARTDATFQLGGLVEGATLECQLDGGAWTPCAALTELTGFAEGAHLLQARQVSRAGLDSSVASYAWKVAPAAATAPTLTSTPTAESALSIASPTAASVVASTATHGRRPAAAGARGGRRTHRHAVGHRHPPRTHRHAVGRKHPPKMHRHAVGRKHPPKTHRHSAGRKHLPMTHRHAGSHKRQIGNTHRHAAQHRHAAKRRQHASKRTHKARVREHAPQHKHAPRHPHHGAPHRRTTKQQARTPARAPARSRHATRRATQVKAHRPASKPRHDATTRRHNAKLKPPPAPTRTPKTNAEHHAKHEQPSSAPAHAPASARHRERHRPADAPTAGGKTHTPAATRRPQDPAPRKAGSRRPARRKAGSQRPARRRTGSVGPKLVIRPFRAQSAVLSSRARRRVRRIAAAVTRARLIVCVGYTDDLGPRSSNVALGLKRARAVCARLRALGVHAAFKAESRGPERPCASNATAGGRALNRRVEVRILD